MFSAGTRVYICSSAVAGKKLGPKRHSLGYVSDNNAVSTIKYVKNFPMGNQSFVVTPLKIVFTRYGKEEKQRCERRDFLQILPIFDKDRGSAATVKLTKEVISVFNDGELSKNPFWKELGANYVSVSANIGSVIPIGHRKIAEITTGNETKAWISSILHNQLFLNLIKNNRNLQTLKHLTNDDDLFVWLSNASRKSSTRHDLLHWAEEHTNNMKRLVRILRCTTIAFDKRVLDFETRSANIMLDKSSFRTSSFFNWLINRLFDDESIMSRKENAVNSAIGSKPSHLIFTRNMRSVRSTYLNLKLKYV